MIVILHRGRFLAGTGMSCRAVHMELVGRIACFPVGRMIV